MSIKVLVSLHCNDCGLPHGRGTGAALCWDCRKKRRAKSNRTERYRAMQRKYNHSFRGKMRHGIWYDKQPRCCS